VRIEELQDNAINLLVSEQKNWSRRGLEDFLADYEQPVQMKSMLLSDFAW